MPVTLERDTAWILKDSVWESVGRTTSLSKDLLHGDLFWFSCELHYSWVFCQSLSLLLPLVPGRIHVTLLTWIPCKTGDLRGSLCWLALNAGCRCVCLQSKIYSLCTSDRFWVFNHSAFSSPDTIFFNFFICIFFYKLEYISRKNLGLFKVCPLKGEMCLFELQCWV